MLSYFMWRIREVWCVIRGGHHYTMGYFFGFRQLTCPCGSIVGLEDSVFDIDGNERSLAPKSHLSWHEVTKELHRRMPFDQNPVYDEIKPFDPRRGYVPAEDTPFWNMLIDFEEIYSPDYDPQGIIIGLARDSKTLNYMGDANGIHLFVDSMEPGGYVPGNSSSFQPKEEEYAEYTIRGFLL
jgi:hypothetical protein